MQSGGGHIYDIVIAGIAHPYSWEEGSSSSDRDKKESGVFSHPTSTTHSPTPPPQRRLAKSFSVAPAAVTKGNYGFLLLASSQLCHCSPFITSFSYFCSICFMFLFQLFVYLCFILNLTVSSSTLLYVQITFIAFSNFFSYLVIINILNIKETNPSRNDVQNCLCSHLKYISLKL
jgi:hypothetical protein